MTVGMIKMHGKTEGCPGCNAIGTGRVTAHSETCRQRLRQELSKSDQGRYQLVRDRLRVDAQMQQAIEHEARQDPEINDGIQKRKAEVENIRKRHRSTAASSSSPAAQELRDEGQHEVPGASSSSSGSRAAEAEQHRRGQKRIPDVHVRDLQEQAESDARPRGIKREAKASVRELADQADPGIMIGHWGLSEESDDDDNDIEDMSICQSRMRNRDRKEKPPVLLWGTSKSSTMSGRGALQKQLLEMRRRYDEQQKAGRYHLYEGSECNDGEWQTSKNLLLNISGTQNITGSKYITNCPAVAEEFRAHHPDIASLKFAVRQQKHWDRAGKVITSIVNPEKVVHEGSDAEQRVPPEETVWAD